MKNLILILFTFSSLYSYSQKIEERIFDKFDSVYTITTNSETLVGNQKGSTFLYAKASFSWLKQAKFTNNPKAKFFDLLFGFKTNTVTSIDNETE